MTECLSWLKAGGGGIGSWSLPVRSMLGVSLLMLMWISLLPGVPSPSPLHCWPHVTRRKHASQVCLPTLMLSIHWAQITDVIHARCGTSQRISHIHILSFTIYKALRTLTWICQPQTVSWPEQHLISKTTSQTLTHNLQLQRVPLTSPHWWVVFHNASRSCVDFGPLDVCGCVSFILYREHIFICPQKTSA